MLLEVHNFIPVLSSEAGLCLTTENWKAAKVTSLSYSLEHLLHKPGLEALKKITDLPHYLGWTGELVLNALSLSPNKEGEYIIKSPYDGSKIRVTSLDLIHLIAHLKPNAVLLPKKILQHCPNLWDYWDNNILPFFYVEDVVHQNLEREQGIWFSDCDLDQLALWPHLPHYVAGTLSKEHIFDLWSKGVAFVETDEPAALAAQGRVYSQAGEIDLSLMDRAMCFEPIDSQCTCSTCTQKLTQAYLHHLLHHTPLLCKRFLIEHNVFWINLGMRGSL